jgi:hypothetical protein
MQRAKATAPFPGVVATDVVEDATLATPDEPPLPQPAATNENAKIETTETTMSVRR